MNSFAPKPVLFVQTSMPVGGAETLLVNLVERLDPLRFAPEVVCLKERGPLGDYLAQAGYTVHSELLANKFDLRVLPRLVRLMRHRRIAAVVTVGAGDKMFWGRLAARLAGVPVIGAALHSTGWPDGVGRLNRWLTPITDAFIAVAEPHGQFLVEHERFPADRVRVIPNGVDTERFQPLADGGPLRAELGLAPTTPLVGILAALRPEKNHELFLAAAEKIRRRVSDAHFVVIGDGPRREPLEKFAADRGLFVPEAPDRSVVHFLGNRSDVPEVLAALNVLALTSHNEASPVSILEAMSCAVPVVSTDVGSVSASVIEGETGSVVPPGDEQQLVERIASLLEQPLIAKERGRAGRQRVIRTASLDVMVCGYEELLADCYARRTGQPWSIEQPRAASEPSETPLAVV
ncbi:glycosyltransferase [Botrimarina hoheduenensis]|nr:glycosyltransferase [Botrimarina hoheduenensis]